MCNIDGAYSAQLSGQEEYQTSRGKPPQTQSSWRYCPTLPVSPYLATKHKCKSASVMSCRTSTKRFRRTYARSRTNEAVVAFVVYRKRQRGGNIYVPGQGLPVPNRPLPQQLRSQPLSCSILLRNTENYSS